MKKNYHFWKKIVQKLEKSSDFDRYFSQRDTVYFDKVFLSRSPTLWHVNLIIDW